MKNFIKILGLISIIALGITLKRFGFFEKLLESIHDLGAGAAPVFLGAYILSCLLFFPSIIMTLGAGILFPLPLAIFLSLLGNSLGSTTALLIGRYGLRAWVQKKTAANSTFQKLENAVQSEGWKITLLARLAPIFPFSIGNYLFGATSISVWVYALTAFVGTIPTAFVYALIGHMAGSLAEASKPHARTTLEWGLLAAGVIATVALSFYIKGFFQHVLDDKTKTGKITKSE